MATHTKPNRPAWVAKYLEFAAWTQDEFRDLLCWPSQPAGGHPLATWCPALVGEVAVATSRKHQASRGRVALSTRGGRA